MLIKKEGFPGEGMMLTDLSIQELQEQEREELRQLDLSQRILPLDIPIGYTRPEWFQVPESHVDQPPEVKAEPVFQWLLQI